MLGFTGPAVDAVLLSVLLYKARWKVFPAFTLMILLDLVSTVLLSLTEDAGHTSSFLRIYATAEVLTFLVQLAVLYEIMKIVLKPTGTLTSRALRKFTMVCALCVLIALATSFSLRPPAEHGIALLQMRSDIFTGLLTCEAVIAMMLAASRVGLPWKSHVMAVGQGLMLWALLTVTVEGLGAYLDPQQRLAARIYFVRSLIYLVTITYWTVSLWREEPARKPISPTMRKYIVALHDQVQYDLGK